MHLLSLSCKRLHPEAHMSLLVIPYFLEIHMENASGSDHLLISVANAS